MWPLDKTSKVEFWSTSSEDPEIAARNNTMEAASDSFGIETVIEADDEVETTVRNQSRQRNLQLRGSDTLRSSSFDGDTTMRSRSSDSTDILDGKEEFTIDKSCSFINGSWVCHPYKTERLNQQIKNNSPGSGRRTAIIETLQEMGVKVFIIDAKSVKSTADVVLHIRRVVSFVARENSIEPRTGPLGFQRCLLYQDQQGRLFNLMLPSHSTGPAGPYLQYLESFSGREAMIAATVLCRSLPCMTEEDVVRELRPAYLSLILGLVFTEEISLSWLNASMMIRATPSVSAHSLSSPVGSDGLRKIVLFMLALAGATTGLFKTFLTMGGIIGAMLILLANLGARSWHFLRWKPVRYNGVGSFLLAYVLAITTGLLLPYMGHRSIAIGGKGAMEYVLKTATIVALIFVISDYDELQKFLVVGSEFCNQDPVNIIVGLWWAITLLCSICLIPKIPHKDQKPPQSGEKLLVENHQSPVGYQVPLLPDFEIDPGMADTGSKCLSLRFELIVGVILAIAGGSGMITLAFTSWDEDFYNELTNSTLGDGNL